MTNAITMYKDFDNLERQQVDPQFCDHKSAFIIYRDADGFSYHCPDCGAMLDEDFEIVPTGEVEW